MAALDTNVLVRWLVDDDAAQVRAVEKLFAKTAAAGELLYVPITVMLEVEWVLRSRYKFAKAEVAEALDGLVSAPELAIQNEIAVEMALWLFKQKDAADFADFADFADCLHVALVVWDIKGPLLTFDVQASKLEGAQLLEG